MAAYANFCFSFPVYVTIPRERVRTQTHNTRDRNECKSEEEWGGVGPYHRNAKCNSQRSNVNIEQSPHIDESRRQPAADIDQRRRRQHIHKAPLIGLPSRLPPSLALRPKRQRQTERRGRGCPSVSVRYELPSPSPLILRAATLAATAATREAAAHAAAGSGAAATSETALLL